MKQILKQTFQEWKDLKYTFRDLNRECKSIVRDIKQYFNKEKIYNYVDIERYQ